MKQGLWIAICAGILLLTACRGNLQPVPKDLTAQEENGETPFSGDSETTFSYHESTDGNAHIKQGMQSQVLCGIQIFDNHLYVCGNSIYRINPATGNVTSVCQRPLCDHQNSECPFIGISTSSFQIVDKKIYFSSYLDWRAGNSGIGYFIYDMENDTIVRDPAKHSNCTRTLNGVLVMEDGREYYYDLEYNKEEDKYDKIFAGDKADNPIGGTGESGRLSD